MSSPQSCSDCGQALRPGARFCPECGRPTPVPTAPSRPPSAPPPDSPGYAPAGTWPAQPAADRVPDDDPLSLFSRPPSPPAHRSGPPRKERPKRSQWLLVAALAAVVIGVGAGVALVALPSHHRPASMADTALNSATAEPSSPAAAPATSSASSASSVASSSLSSPAPTSPGQAAQALSALLTQSGTDRQAVDNAATAVENCSGDLSQDQTTFSQAASARQTLLSQLAALPGSSSLSAPMLQDLTMAWQASAEADQDFVQWTQDEIAQGCSTNDQSDPAFVAATAPDDAATKYKKAFAALWAPVASQYGLPAYQFNQI
jgi:cytoskeletal protein RodZ